MKKQFVGILMVVVLMVAGLVWAPDAVARPAHHSETEIVELVNFTGVGVSRVTRNDNGASFTYSTSGLNPHETYTLWWFIIGPDGDNDGFIVLNASGGIADVNGELHMAGHLQTGEVVIPVDENGDPDRSRVRLGGNFHDPFAFNIAFILINHGPKIPGLVHEQISTRYGGDCANDPDNDNPGPNAVVCTDTQVARLHPPVP